MHKERQPPAHFEDVIAHSDVIFTIGVAGDSGSGKSTFSGAIREMFAPDLVSTITLDDYHRFDRVARRTTGITPLAPEANDIALLEDHLGCLKRGETFIKPVYDHSSGTFGRPVRFSPTKIVILEGLHTLFTPALRRNLDFTLFVDPEETVKREWKIKRDVEGRGYRRTNVLREIEKRKPDYDRYIAPQRAFADSVVRVSPSKYGGGDPTGPLYRVTLLQKRPERTVHNITLSIDLLDILSLSERSFSLEFSPCGLDGMPGGALTVDGELHADVIRQLERHVERETGIRFIPSISGKEYITAVDMVRLILAWRIINTRIFYGDTGDSRRINASDSHKKGKEIID
jgi:phosphoribulokinase